MTKKCVICGVEFKARIREGVRQKYCSLQCCGVSKIGHPVWNEGLKGFRHKGSFKVGYDPKRIVQKVGREHYLWREDASYSPKHKWISKHYKKSGVCRDCGLEKKTYWANVSKTYKRDIDDYRELCAKCHHAFDREDIMAKRAARKRNDLDALAAFVREHE